MNHIAKAQIIAQISQRTGLSPEQSRDAYNSLVAIVQEQLRQGRRVSLTGIGLLSLSDTGRQRITFEVSDELQESVKSKRGKRVSFKASDELRESIKGNSP